MNRVSPLSSRTPTSPRLWCQFPASPRNLPTTATVLDDLISVVKIEQPVVNVYALTWPQRPHWFGNSVTDDRHTVLDDEDGEEGLLEDVHAYADMTTSVVEGASTRYA